MYAYVSTATATDENAVDIVGYSHEHPSQADLMMFMTQYRLNAGTATFVRHADQRRRGRPETSMGASIDTQDIGAMAYRVPYIPQVPYFRVPRCIPTQSGWYKYSIRAVPRPWCIVDS